MPRRPVWLLGLCLLPALATVEASPSRVGLAVAVSADGTRLVAGGDTRALYELDPATLAVKRRAFIGRRAEDMVFSPDGKTILVRTRKALLWVAADSLEVVETLEPVSALTVARPAGLLAAHDRSWDHIKLLAMRDGAERGRIPVEKRKYVAIGLSQDGTKLAMLHGATRDQSEKKVDRRAIPDEVRKAGKSAVKEFQLRNDGKTARFVVRDLAAGTSLLDTKLWYGTLNVRDLPVLWVGDQVHVFSGSGNARIDAAGEATFFDLPAKGVSTLQAAHDGSFWVSGYANTGLLTRVPEMTHTTFELDALPEGNELIKDFDVSDAGVIYAGTSDFRIVRLGKAGVVEKSAPVH